MNPVVESEAQRRFEIALAQASLPMSQRDPELVRKACEEMDATREEIRRRVGIVDIAVELVREART
jgi:hypothetical protein